MRLGEIGLWQSGSTPPRTNSDYYEGSIPWLKIGDLNDGYILKSTEHISELALEKFPLRLNPAGSVLMAMYGSIGKLGILDKPMATNQAICSCVPYKEIENKYLFYSLMGMRNDFIKMGAGCTQQNISKEKIISYFCPFPPLEEQKRISDKLDEIFALLDTIDSLQMQCGSNINTLKGKLLAAALTGCLVEQRPEEGTAKELYCQIQEEKERLIKEGKIKKGKPLPEVRAEEEPFEIPETWKWVRLGEIIKLISGVDLDASKYDQCANGIPYITGASNFKGQEIIFNRWTKNPTRIAHCGDLLLTCKGTVGKTSILEVNEAHIARQVMALSPIFVNTLFLQYFIESQIKYLNVSAKSFIPGIDRDSILNLAVPLPPLEEQKRIVNKLKEIMPLISSLGEARR